ncbi:MAG: histidine kinase [Lentimicrobium sp.]|jgi:LytS/YehU family sensor histidine kinase|nr:histidine kinase [Lentimicrobium sp.]MDD4597312.1 histidine kinase [Lentimicrobiaceae bacterium]MDY0024617.1 histidine kinase [Lentimicrobium sp.]
MKRALRSGILLYFAAWLMVALVHYLLIGVWYKIPAPIAITEVLVYNMVYALLGIGIWFLVKISDFEKIHTVALIVRFIIVCSVTLLIWLGAGYLIMSKITHIPENYPDSIADTFALRGIYGLLLFVMMVSVFYLINSNYNLKQHQQREEQLRSLLHESELNALKSQIKPHFLFNALNSISSLTLTNPAKAQEMVINLSEFMRYSLRFSNQEMSTLSQELNQLKLYLEIEKVRFGQRLQVIEEIETELGNWPLPSMVLQPLVENAIKHGIYDTIDSTIIRIKAVEQRGKLLISIKNHFDAAMIHHKGTGTGLSNVTERLRMIYGVNNAVEVLRDANIFEVKLNIPDTWIK